MTDTLFVLGRSVVRISKSCPLPSEIFWLRGSTRYVEGKNFFCVQFCERWIHEPVLVRELVEFHIGKVLVVKDGYVVLSDVQPKVMMYEENVHFIFEERLYHRITSTSIVECAQERNEDYLLSPAFFKYAIKQNACFKEELMMKAWHPARLQRIGFFDQEDKE